MKSYLGLFPVGIGKPRLERLGGTWFVTKPGYVDDSLWQAIENFHAGRKPDLGLKSGGTFQFDAWAEEDPLPMGCFCGDSVLEQCRDDSRWIRLTSYLHGRRVVRWSWFDVNVRAPFLERVAAWRNRSAAVGE